jgi:uncharacterized protein
VPPHRVPIRTCAGCRARVPKSDLVRVARGADGLGRLDPTGAAPGRGAYVHPRADCVEAAIAKGGLARALRAGVAPDEVGRLRDLVG